LLSVKQKALNKKNYLFIQLLELPQKARKLMDLPAQRLTDIMTIRNREKGKCH